jgi:hypothetical protein
MWPVANVCGLLLAVLTLALWVLSRPTLSRRHRLVSLLGGIGIFALVFCAISPDDDLFQQELIRPQAQCTRLSAFAKLAPKRPCTGFWMGVCVRAEYPALFPGTGRFRIGDQLPNIAAQLASSTSIHSPPQFVTGS